MARPREFDEAAVLCSALPVFWRSGYEGCSIEELVQATGLSRQSIYNAFGDKAGLFQAVLGAYRQALEVSLAPLDTPGAGLGALRRYMVDAVGQLAPFGACLLVKTAFDVNRRDPAIRAAVEAGAETVRARFARAIARAVASGDVSPCDVSFAASYLYSVLNGVCALAQTGGSSTDVDRVLGHALSTLRCPLSSTDQNKGRGAPRSSSKRSTR